MATTTAQFVQLRLHRIALARHLEFGEETKGLPQLLLLGFLIALRTR